MMEMDRALLDPPRLASAPPARLARRADGEDPRPGRRRGRERALRGRPALERGPRRRGLGQPDLAGGGPAAQAGRAHERPRPGPHGGGGDRPRACSRPGAGRPRRQSLRRRRRLLAEHDRGHARHRLPGRPANGRAARAGRLFGPRPRPRGAPPGLPGLPERAEARGDPQPRGLVPGALAADHFSLPALITTAGTFWSRTSVLKAGTSVSITCFSFASWTSILPFRSS